MIYAIKPSKSRIFYILVSVSKNGKIEFVQNIAKKQKNVFLKLPELSAKFGKIHLSLARAFESLRLAARASLWQAFAYIATALVTLAMAGFIGGLLGYSLAALYSTLASPKMAALALGIVGFGLVCWLDFKMKKEG